MKQRSPKKEVGLDASLPPLPLSLSLPFPLLIYHPSSPTPPTLKMFLPMTLFGFAVLLPLNVTDGYLHQFLTNSTQNALINGNTTYSQIDTLSLANITPQSSR